ncbi:NUDIX hydrolase [Salinarchaeum laminariae]|uniref:NUDIX hydrolase n=1 Tax=Salinarchaeum laminariae TaxID=869888 RepID=UPI0020C16146|nr:NUDIX hydrolase [Salinarchaeum laminariae]
MSEHSTAEHWTLLDSVTEYETGWYDGGYDRYEQPDGSTKRYYWAALAPAVVVVGITEDDRVVFVEQFRPTVRESQFELVAGIVDEHDGEPADPVDPAAYEAAAKRELAEETGYVAETAELLQSYAVATGVLRHRRGIVVATGLTAGEPDRDDNEFLSVDPVPADDALAVAREPPTNDATIEGLLLAAADGYL